jgi:hypothetical protein
MKYAGLASLIMLFAYAWDIAISVTVGSMLGAWRQWRDEE